MAVKFGELAGVRAGEQFLLPPDSIKISDNPALRGRAMPATDFEIQKLAMDIFNKGQLQAISVRKVAGEPLCVYGHTRLAAIKMLQEGFSVDDIVYHQPDIMVRCTLFSGNEKEAFLAAHAENHSRVATSLLDDMIKQRYMREHLGMSDSEIARLYQWPPMKVGSLKKCLELSDSQRILLHTGDLKLSVALTLLEFPSDRRDDIIRIAQDTDEGKIIGSTLLTLWRKQEYAKTTEERSEEDDKLSYPVATSAPTIVDGPPPSAGESESKPASTSPSKGGGNNKPAPKGNNKPAPKGNKGSRDTIPLKQAEYRGYFKAWATERQSDNPPFSDEVYDIIETFAQMLEGQLTPDAVPGYLEDVLENLGATVA